MRIGAIIQARSGSTRLPGKIYKKIGDKTILEHVCERVSGSKVVNKIILAMPEYDRETLPSNVKAIRANDVFFGDELNVLSRYFYAAKRNCLDLIVRITADCPLVLPELIDEMLIYYMENNLNCYLNNGVLRGVQPPYPDGFDVEIFPYWILCKTFLNATDKEDLEHVCTWMWRGKNVHFETYRNEVPHLFLPCSEFHFSVDTQKDLDLVRKVYDSLNKGRTIQEALIEATINN